MDTDRFDDLLRALVSGTSRRGVFAALTGSLLAAQSRHSDADARKNKNKKSNGTPAPLAPSSPPPPPPPPLPRCANGVLDAGSESDVDCGGTCPRCANGKTCTSRADCTSARCFGSV
jgi:hypothetical protein